MRPTMSCRKPGCKTFISVLNLTGLRQAPKPLGATTNFTMRIIVTGILLNLGILSFGQIPMMEFAGKPFPKFVINKRSGNYLYLRRNRNNKRLR